MDPFSRLSLASCRFWIVRSEILGVNFYEKEFHFTVKLNVNLRHTFSVMMVTGSTVFFLFPRITDGRIVFVGISNE